MKKISVIIPIYNSEKYLVECLTSLLNQNYENVEFLLINDGSTDNSLNICKKFKKKDNRFIIFNQKNLGVSSARNTGIENSTGDIITFVDSDDILLNNALNIISQNMNNNELYCFGYNLMFKNKAKSIFNCSQSFNYIEFENSIVENNIIGGFLWNKAFLASIIKENNITFDNTLHYCEDLLFVIKYAGKCKKMYYNCDVYYNYRMRKSSVSFNCYTKKNTSILKSYEIIIQNLLLKKNKYKINYFYIWYYYKFKKIIVKYDIAVSKKLLNNEKTIMKLISFDKMLKLLLIKHTPKFYTKVKKIIIAHNYYD